MSSRRSPYHTALTLEQWRQAQAERQRPLTDESIGAWTTGRRASDARRSKLTQSTPRPRQEATR